MLPLRINFQKKNRFCRFRSLQQFWRLISLFSLSIVLPAWASEEPLDPTLNERVLWVPGDPHRPVTLEVTTFTPDGPGPFPLAILNHGKEFGDPKTQARYRSAYLARYFLSRGYVVVLPMMRGFADSGGEFDSWGCDVSACGLAQVADIEAVIDYMVRQPNIDGTRMIVSGQSLGGWNTLAFATHGHDGVRGYLNFAGGIKEPKCPAWEDNLIKGAAEFGKRTHLPSLWFYGDNDSKFPPRVFRGMYDQYVKAGGPATLIDYGNFLTDAHNMLGSLEGFPIWMSKVDNFLITLGLPGKLLESRYLPATIPPPSHFAALEDINAVPYINEGGKKTYQEFLTKPFPRVFLITSDGASASFDGGFDPLTRGLNRMRQLSADTQLYAVDDHVVWTGTIDPVKAVEAYQQGANQEDPLAMYRLSEAYETGAGIAQDSHQALDWLEKSAEKGLSLAQSRLGKKMENGKGIAQDYGKALEWFHRAAEQGDLPAETQIGNMYAHGWGVSPDSLQALNWFQKAADQGFAAAQFNIGYLYENGLGVEKDKVKAAHWFQKAASQGFDPAMQELKKMAIPITLPNSDGLPPHVTP